MPAFLPALLIALVILTGFAINTAFFASLIILRTPLRFFDFLCENLHRVVVRVQKRKIPADAFHADISRLLAAENTSC